MLYELLVYVLQVEKELSDVCREIISLLSTYLIPSATEAEPKVRLYIEWVT